MENIIISIITGGLALLGEIITNNPSNSKIEQQLTINQAVTNEKIETLTEEVKKHNTFGDRITRLETKVDLLERGSK